MWYATAVGAEKHFCELKRIKQFCMFISPLQDGKTPMETLYSWQNGAKSLLCNFSQEKLDQ